MTREKLLDYVFYLQQKLGVRYTEVVKLSTLGLKPDILSLTVINIVQEALIDYYPEDNVDTKIILDFSGSAFPGSYNSNFTFTSKDDIYVIGNLTFLFTTLSDFNDAFAELVNADEFLSAEVNDDDTITITAPSFIDADFFTLAHSDSGESIVVTTTVSQRGVEACENCLSEDEICQLINFAQKEINKKLC